MMNMTGQTEASFANDGTFWMDFNDFMEEFEGVDLCKVYSKEEGWNEVVIEDKWVGEYAAGLPGGGNDITKNPQYGIEISKACKGFAVMRIKERDPETVAFAKFPGFLNIQTRDGELIQVYQKAKSVCTLGVSRTAILADEILMPSKISYPYTFTMMVTNSKKGEEGEGNFSIQIFAKDPKLAVKKLN